MAAADTNDHKYLVGVINNDTRVHLIIIIGTHTHHKHTCTNEKHSMSIERGGTEKKEREREGGSREERETEGGREEREKERKRERGREKEKAERERGRGGEID